jgi:hypothetical protein
MVYTSGFIPKIAELVRLEAFLFEEGFDTLPLGQGHHGEAGRDHAGVERIATELLAGVVAGRWLRWNYFDV